MRAVVGVATAAVLAGELVAARWRPPSALFLLGVAVLAGVPRAWRLLAAVALLGLALGVSSMDTVARPALPADHLAHLALPLRTTLVGRIVAAPERREGRVVLLVEAESVGRGTARRPVSGRVRLTIRHPARHWRYGERLEAEPTIRLPRNFENPGRFDWVAQLARRGVHVTASVWEGRDVVRRPARVRGPRAWLERRREHLVAAIATAVPPPEGAVLRALVVGDESGIDAGLREAFTRAGVVHVLSISGLHVGLVAAAAFAVARWLLGRSEWLLLSADVGRLAALLGLAPVALYAALAGMGVATLRSAFMVAAAVLAGLLGRRADVLRTLALAALVLGLVWPGTPLEIAFQLSFVSVLAIACGVRRLAGAERSTWRARVRDALLVSPCALAGTAPLTAFHFHQVSLAALVANPLAVPIFGAVVVVLGLVGAALEPLWPAAARLLFVAAGVVLRPGIAIVRRLGRPDWAALDVPIPSLLELALLYALLGGLAVLHRRPARAVVLAAAIGLLVDVGWWTHERFGRHALRLTFLDVGQGDAAVAELPGGGVLVVDAGGFPASDFDTGAAVVSPFLLTRKILHVDVLAMTHAHPDHAGGLAYLLLHHRPREFWWTGVPGDGPAWQRLATNLAESGARLRVLDAGARPGWGVEVLHPPPHAGPLTLNDSSLTLRLGGARGVLLTGDIEARAEAMLLQAPDRVAAPVLKVPHHGSRTSSTPGFLAAVEPRVAIVSVGADNHYGLPSAAIEARYRARGTCLLRTDRCGAVTVTIDGPRLEVRTMRPECGCPATPPS
jgi:competence protein ComEC